MFFLKLLEAKKWGKLSSFGVDMFFLKLLESKKWGKLISFGVDMFFSNSWNPKNGENWLVLVLTCFSQTPGTQKMGKIDYFLLTCFFSTSWNPKNGKITSFGVDMFFLKLLESKKWGKLISFGVDMFFSQTFGVDMFFSNSCKSKNGENWLVLVLTDWNLEPSAYTRIEGKIWKCKVTPKNNVFFQKGLNRHAYIHILIYIYISQLLESKKWVNWLVLVLTCFFSTSWNPKNGKITSFGVDMFFSNSWSPKNGENWLVLVLTCFFLKLLVLTCFSQTRVSQKVGKID